MRVPKDPLLSFLLLGAAIYAAVELSSRRGTAAAPAIVVTQSQVDNLVAVFTRTWQRPPTEAERQGLIDEHVREEVYYREAIAMGLDRDDTVIRRRLQQKLEFLSEDSLAAAEPTDAELRTCLNAHPEKFRIEARFSFDQIFLDSERRETLPADVARLLATLNDDGADPELSALGDTTLLEPRFENVSAGEVAHQFGERFASALGALPTGQWHGPLASSYGAHVVRLNARVSERLPDLEEVRHAVRLEYVNTRRREASERFYQSLRQRYTVTIEPHHWAASPERVAEAE